MNHKANTTNISCSSPIKKATWVFHHGTQTNIPNSLLFLRYWIQVHKVINLNDKSMDRGHFIVKYASVSEIPNTQKNENWWIYEVCKDWDIAEPVF